MQDSNDISDKNVAIPGIVGRHDQSMEVEYPDSPDSHDNNDKLPGSVGVHEQTIVVQGKDMLESYHNNNKSVAIPEAVGV